MFIKKSLYAAVLFSCFISVQNSAECRAASLPEALTEIEKLTTLSLELIQDLKDRLSKQRVRRVASDVRKLSDVYAALHSYTAELAELTEQAMENIPT